MILTNSPLEVLAKCIAHAQYEGFSNIEYETKDWVHFRDTGEGKYTKKYRRPNSQDFEVYTMFTQTWGSTSLGFDGIGGAAVTTAYSVVLYMSDSHEFLVYFDGTFAYKVNGTSRNIEKFREDMNQHNLCKQSKSHIYN